MSWYTSSADQNTGQSQWEPPAFSGAPITPAPAQVPTAGHSKRRQYAAGQTQMYYGTDGGVQPPYPGDQGGGSAFFTPGEAQPVQQQQPQYAHIPPPGGFSAGGYVIPTTPSYREPQPQPQVGVLADQFSQMGMGAQAGYGGQKQVGDCDEVALSFDY